MKAPPPTLVTINDDRFELKWVKATPIDMPMAFCLRTNEAYDLDDLAYEIDRLLQIRMALRKYVEDTLSSSTKPQK